MPVMRRTPLAAALLALSIGLSGPREGRAEVSAYEGFDYEPVGAALLGADGGSGFAGPWSAGGFNASIHDHCTIAAGSLEFGELLTSGNRLAAGALEAPGRGARPLATPLRAGGATGQ